MNCRCCGIGWYSLASRCDSRAIGGHRQTGDSIVNHRPAPVPASHRERNSRDHGSPGRCRTFPARWRSGPHRAGAASRKLVRARRDGRWRRSDRRAASGRRSQRTPISLRHRFVAHAQRAGEHLGERDGGNDQLVVTGFGALDPPPAPTNERPSRAREARSWWIMHRDPNGVVFDGLRGSRLERGRGPLARILADCFRCGPR